MQARKASCRALFIASPLLVLTACTNAPTSASGNAATGATQVARVHADDANSVNAVSDALGRRLDDMVSARQASR